ncbi:arsenic transporter [Cellulomonas carbonis]|uniref:Arsenical pump membrane protein n=1 Tax=Cellulomonas carbonis T26 TaxID=947969 RepID=A0A0A0BYM9_9CELL|nr:arsenic transporter [Cellulomonas carbonis]KGM12777.1 arsenical pump membrane protein [Cellulomonas carbonis T26]GGC14389.1 arsenical pump membrane protein [Cellulomonas carbonis]
MLLAVVIFALTLTLVIWQPRGLGIGWSALGGAAVALITGVVQLGDVPDVWVIVWNATLTFVAVIIISLVLDEAGTFEWAALHVARWGRGNGRMLFNLIVVLGAAIAAVFANDGAALILTPIVYQMLLALRFDPKAAFAFVMATGFVADTTSLPLVVSNLVNIVSADFFGIGFGRYALVMIPVSLASLAASLLVLRLFFRKSIPARYDVADLARPADVVHDHVTFRAGWVVLGFLLVGYFVADPLGVPIAAVAGLGAIAIVLTAARKPAWVFARLDARLPAVETVGAASAVPDHTRSGVVHDDIHDHALGTAVLDEGPTPPSSTSCGRIAVAPVLRSAPWQVVLFSLGMYLVVYGLRNQGLTDSLGEVFAWFGEQGPVAAAGGTGFLVAGMSSVMNNMPTVLVAALGIDAAGATGLTHELMVYANVIGADLGPKITPIGSLATLLWLHVLDRKGMHIGWGTYFKIGIVLTIPVLAVTLLALVGWLTVIGV